MADKDSKNDAEDQDRDAEADAEEREEADGAAEEGEESDAAAHRVAEALGVDGDDDDKDLGVGDVGAPLDEAVAAVEAANNRAARRREDAVERRRKRRGKAAASPDAEAPLPRDKNARAKELLKRRREQASEPTRPINLLPAEMVDDAFARSTSAAGKWIRTNFGKIQWVILAGIAAAGYAIYTSQIEKTAAAAIDALVAGITVEHGKVMAEDKRSDEEKEYDTSKIYKTADERTEAALAAYRKAAAEHPGSASALLAKLGEAGVLLDKRDWAGAIDAYKAVLASKLATADADVRGRSIEGVGLAKEGKGDIDEAMASFKELQAIDERGFKELGMYHEARMLLAKGDKDKAKDLLKQIHDKLVVPTPEGKPFRYLETLVDEALRRLDPNALPTKAPVIGGDAKGSAMSPDQMAKIQKMLQDAAKKKAEAPAEH